MLILFSSSYSANFEIYFSINALFSLQQLNIPCVLDFYSSFLASACLISLSFFISTSIIEFLKILFSIINCSMLELYYFENFWFRAVKLFNSNYFSDKSNFVDSNASITFFKSSIQVFLAKFMSSTAIVLYLYFNSSVYTWLCFSRAIIWFLSDLFYVWNCSRSCS